MQAVGFGHKHYNAALAFFKSFRASVNKFGYVLIFGSKRRINISEIFIEVTRIGAERKLDIFESVKDFFSFVVLLSGEIGNNDSFVENGSNAERAFNNADEIFITEFVCRYVSSS